MQGHYILIWDHSDNGVPRKHNQDLLIRLRKYSVLES